MTYKFVLLGESVVLDDKRATSRNVYKRFLECLPPTLATSADVPTVTTHLNYGKPAPYKPGGGKRSKSDNIISVMGHVWFQLSGITHGRFELA